MYPARPGEFTYHRPTTVAEALSLLGDGDARPLAGGHSLLPLMKIRLAGPSALVDLGRIEGLDAISRDGDTLTIGATATHAAVASSEAVRAACPALADAAGLIGDRQVRNRGTIGGSISHADPGADYPTVLTALDATVVVNGSGGEREVPIDDFFQGIFTTALGPGELVTAVRLPACGSGTGAAYAKKKHPASGYAVVGVGALVVVDGGGTCTAARVAIGGVTGTPVRATAAEQVLVGDVVSLDTATRAADTVAQSLGGGEIADTYASAEYRVHLASVLAKRAIAAAIERAAA
jgi:aerobic carbon-monoxide dehydrogenase medium subunit